MSISRKISRRSSYGGSAGIGGDLSEYDSDTYDGGLGSADDGLGGGDGNSSSNNSNSPAKKPVSLPSIHKIR